MKIKKYFFLTFFSAISCLHAQAGKEGNKKQPSDKNAMNHPNDKISEGGNHAKTDLDLFFDSIDREPLVADNTPPNQEKNAEESGHYRGKQSRTLFDPSADENWRNDFLKMLESDKSFSVLDVYKTHTPLYTPSKNFQDFLMQSNRWTAPNQEIYIGKRNPTLSDSSLDENWKENADKNFSHEKRMKGTSIDETHAPLLTPNQKKNDEESGHYIAKPKRTFYDPSLGENWRDNFLKMLNPDESLDSEKTSSILGFYKTHRPLYTPSDNPQEFLMQSNIWSNPNENSAHNPERNLLEQKAFSKIDPIYESQLDE